jgi:hypothetical protein
VVQGLGNSEGKAMAGNPTIVNIHNGLSIESSEDWQIEVWSIGGAWFWCFPHETSGRDVPTGPFSSRRAALTDATHFCYRALTPGIA